MSGRDRNKPCWCGSGLKFKKCHLDRETQERPSLWDMRRDSQKIFQAKTCLHPLASPSTCNGPIVRAHTVRRSADLRIIARTGHVYRTSGDVVDLKQSGGRLIPKLIGVNEASTFLGFCNRHDTEVFAPIETKTLGPTKEQAFLLAYRPLCKELYLKERLMEIAELVRKGDKGRDLKRQIEIQTFVNDTQLGVGVALRDLRSQKARFDALLLRRDFGQMRSVAIHLDVAPDLMCSGFVQPQYTFDGAHLQDLMDFDVELDAVSFTLAANETGGIAIFSWAPESDRVCRAFVDSLIQMPRDDIPDALVRFSTSEFENTYMRPDWWEELSDRKKKALLRRFHHGVGFESVISSAYLASDGLDYVKWRVTNVSEIHT